MDVRGIDEQLREFCERNSPPFDEAAFLDRLRRRTSRSRKQASTPRRTSGLRVAVYASLVVILVAAIAVGSLEAVRHLGKSAPILVITDETTVTTARGLSTQPVATTEAAVETPVAMFRGGFGRTGVYPAGGPSQPPELLWKFKTEGAVVTSPAVSNEVLYVGSFDGEAVVSTIYALDAQSGNEKWKFTADGRVTSPAVSDGVVYVGSGLRLYALDKRTGEERWDFVMGGGTYSSPAVWGGMVYSGSEDGYFYALDAQSGTEKWKFKTGGRIVSSPAISGGIVYFDSEDGYLYALDAHSGEQRWKFTWSAPVNFIVTPAVYGGVVYAAGGPYLYALDAQSGDQKWRFDAGNGLDMGQPAISGGVVYVGGSVVDIDTGREERTLAGVYVCDTSPVISGGVVYFGVFWGGSVYAVDLQSGEKKWEFDTGPVINSDPAVSDGVLYVGDFDGYLYALK